ncbi:hypothetical protein GPL20_36300 [Bradyrhizobium cajani]|uniref:Uncharacterized protein n=1 Tax=Bradyrhizobium cajani TaxID=1928661 RepID=A0A844TJ12_9BRAD|nr:hypothetical protein [Bradyrhizobium cajani]
MRHRETASIPHLRDEIGINRHRALGYCLSMIFSENRFTLFRIMLQPNEKGLRHCRSPLLEGLSLCADRFASSGSPTR